LAAELKNSDLCAGQLLLHGGQKARRAGTVTGLIKHISLSGAGRDVPPRRHSAQFRKPEDALHSRRRRERERSGWRNASPHRECRRQIPGQDVVGTGLYGETTGQRKCS
jgi:hypothetical protein